MQQASPTSTSTRRGRGIAKPIGSENSRKHAVEVIVAEIIRTINSTETNVDALLYIVVTWVTPK